MLQHLFDAAAVGEILWDVYLAPGMRRRIDAVCGGRGRDVLRLLCALHDVGKATPAFQSKDPALAAAVKAMGLRCGGFSRGAGARWHHTLAGAVIVRDVLRRLGWSVAAVEWVWPIIAGHHGMVPALSALTLPSARRAEQWLAHGGTDDWAAAQADVVTAVAEALAVDLRDVPSSGTPSRSLQLALAGAVIMADWIASGEHFGPVPADSVSMPLARSRAANAWKALELRGGWVADSLAPERAAAWRFDHAPRPAQRSALELVESMTAPGFVVIEAPTGEGKTQTALAAAEILARRFGADGLYFGMPTRATCDPMYTKLIEWVKSIDAGLPVGLLHGKRQLNKDWATRIQAERPTFAEVDDCGMEDPFGSATPVAPATRAILSRWLLGRNRGMLMPVTVGTIDQLLHAATRTRHVMLRHFGLAGKVVVLDEIHSYDIYMSEFLVEALRWLGGAGVPVIALSATLTSQDRERLTAAWLQGARAERDVPTIRFPDDTQYPAARAVWLDDSGTRTAASAPAPSWRASAGVRVGILDEDGNGPMAVRELLRSQLPDRGVALVIRNTVRRAQDTYRELAALGQPGDIVLLHGRLTAGARATRTERVLDQLRADNPDRKDLRLIVVATQVAEQSFDVDADFLITDIAPIDLLIQRIGRLHRHARPEADRPDGLGTPRVVVTGLQRAGEGPPRLDRGIESVYGRWPLLRAADLVAAASTGAGWSLPRDAPELVAAGYDPDAPVPPAWERATSEALRQWRDTAERRAGNASKFLLSGTRGLGVPTLAGLHERGIEADDDDVAACVRDGAESFEVILVRRSAAGYRTLAGTDLGPNGDAVTDPAIADEVIGDTVALPSRIQQADVATLTPLPSWRGHEWFDRSRALVLDEHGMATLVRHRLQYDDALGLMVRANEPRAGGDN
ncbi:CRISPR-associated helicase/endonuclease Cas3 [Pilimelia anulata]|uniref:CRISPR-associated helicase/endonuclease Cas3 n=1 Tax=Pilimelia anulata TaxID=53371 RepID=A0A8J3B8A8_9ACTN|nr:CRISPR-associated helicase/endonuclease Cas3 [Pilimelia anulata]